MYYTIHSTTKILTLVYYRHCEWQFLEEVHLLLRADQSGGVSPRFIFSSLYSLYSFCPCLCASHVFPLPLSLCLPFISFFLVFVSLMYSFCLCLCLCLQCVMRVFACVLVGVCAFAKVSPRPFLSLCFPDGRELYLYLISFSIVVVFAFLHYKFHHKPRT